MATPKTVILKGAGINYEFPAGGAITPGMLVTVNSSGAAIAHATAAKNAVKMFARENELEGKGIDDAYAATAPADRVLCTVLQPGSEVYALLPAAAAAVVIGDFLEAGGTGTVRKAATDAATDDTQREAMVGMALEAVDNSGGGGLARIRMMVL